jgi:succinoglycan biosynthesis protein ExoA
MSEAWPFVSVVIPMRNEGSEFAQCLDAVLGQDYPADRMEVIVVDGDSDDASASLAQEYAARDARVRVLRNPQRIVPTALNIGIRAARGGIIARVDGHTRIAPDYLRVGVETLRRTGADNAGGPMRAVGGGGFGDAVAAAMSSRFGIGAYFHFGTVEREVDTVYMGMWPRAVFERAGLFDEELVRNQDDELNYRLRKLGGRVVLNPKMRSRYQNRQGVRRLARQFYQYGEWKVRVLQKHPRQMSWRHFVPPAFVAGLAGLALLAPIVPLAGGAMLGLMGSYALILLGVSAWQSRAAGWAAWPRTALAFAIIHITWGTGFLVGLFRHAGRWRRAEPVPPALEPTMELRIE